MGAPGPEGSSRGTASHASSGRGAGPSGGPEPPPVRSAARKGLLRPPSPSPPQQGTRPQPVRRLPQNRAGRPPESPRAGPSSPHRAPGAGSSRTSGLTTPLGRRGPPSRVSAPVRHPASRSPSLPTPRSGSRSVSQTTLGPGAGAAAGVRRRPRPSALPTSGQAFRVGLCSDKCWAGPRVPEPPGRPHRPPGLLPAEPATEVLRPARDGSAGWTPTSLPPPSAAPSEPFRRGLFTQKPLFPPFPSSKLSRGLFSEYHNRDN